MIFPRPRRKRPRFNGADADHAPTEQWLGQISTGPADGTTWHTGPAAVQFTGGSGIGVMPAPVPAAAPRTEPVTRLRAEQRYRPPAPAAPEPPAPRPPAIRPLAPELPPHEGLPPAQVTAMLGAIRYPGADGTPEDYAAVMRRWSHLTGTASGLESPGAWPRHALEAMPGEAARVTS